MVVENCAICGEIIDPEENFVYLSNICVCEMCAGKNFAEIVEHLDAILTQNHNVEALNDVIDVEYKEET